MTLRVLRWGQAEYEVGPLRGLPPGVEVVEAAGEDAPLESADVLVVPSIRPVRAAQLPRLRRCQLVVTTTSGVDHVDVAALAAAGIPTARLPLARRDAVVETALGMMLALRRRFADFEAGVSAGRWERDRLPAIGAGLLDRVGVVGVGVIGRRMVEVLRALGATVVATDPAVPGSATLDEACACPVVTLHCELTPETRGLFDAARITRLAPGTILVNTARGKLVDVAAAHAALVAGHLGGLGLDVYPQEPASLAALRHPRAILLPHAAGWHPRLGEAIAVGVEAAVRALIAGAPIPHLVGGPPATPGAPGGAGLPGME